MASPQVLQAFVFVQGQVTRSVRRTAQLPGIVLQSKRIVLTDIHVMGKMLPRCSGCMALQRQEADPNGCVTIYEQHFRMLPSCRRPSRTNPSLDSGDRQTERKFPHWCHQRRVDERMLQLSHLEFWRGRKEK
jgi:hypothetical protein